MTGFINSALRFVVLVAALLAGGPFKALAASSPSPWASLFNASEEWVGPAGTELTVERYRQLITSQVDDDPITQHKWSILTRLIRSQRAPNQLRLVHQFFNSLPYRSDAALYRSVDYWSSAGEFLRHGGDCEDYAIAKYRALVDSGFPISDLRVVLVEDTITKEPHAVLAAQLDRVIYILDNQRSEVVRDRDLGHYRPLYSLNELDVWRHRTPSSPGAIDGLAVATQAK